MVIVIVRHLLWVFRVFSSGYEPLVCVAIPVSQDEVVDVDHLLAFDPGAHFMMGPHVLYQILLDGFLVLLVICTLSGVYRVRLPVIVFSSVSPVMSCREHSNVMYHRVSNYDIHIRCDLWPWFPIEPYVVTNASVPQGRSVIIPSPVTMAGRGNGSGAAEAPPGFEPFS